MTAPKDAMTVTVRLMGREYTVACPPEEHEALIASAEYLDQRMTAIRRRGKALGAERIAVMAALNITRELLELQGRPEVAKIDPKVVDRLHQLSLDIDNALSQD